MCTEETGEERGECVCLRRGHRARESPGPWPESCACVQWGWEVFVPAGGCLEWGKEKCQNIVYELTRD